MTDNKCPAKAVTFEPGCKTTTQSNDSINNEYILSLEWLNDFQMLTEKYSYLGFFPDLAGLSIVEVWGLFCWLKKIGE